MKEARLISSDAITLLSLWGEFVLARTFSLLLVVVLVWLLFSTWMLGVFDTLMNSMFHVLTTTDGRSRTSFSLWQLLACEAHHVSTVLQLPTYLWTVPVYRGPAHPIKHYSRN